MPRRRMLDPGIWKDPAFGHLPDDAKLLFIGLVSNSDDEGRIIATPESLKADIFPYDHKKTASVVKKLRDFVITAMKNCCLYENDHVEYIALLRWNRYQSPKHFKPSILPTPPVEPYVEREPSRETLGETSRETNSLLSTETFWNPRSGQSSQDKVILDRVSPVKVDFRNVIDNEKDLTDRLTKTLEEYSAGGRRQMMEVVKKLWTDSNRILEPGVFDVVWESLEKYPCNILASAFVKGAKYLGGKKKPANYLLAILEEKMENGR